jgi:hypothetical protein
LTIKSPNFGTKIAKKLTIWLTILISRLKKKVEAECMEDNICILASNAKNENEYQVCVVIRKNSNSPIGIFFFPLG